jgi:hypothetical protein
MQIGRTHIDISARGCIDCGTEHAAGWHLAETVSVRIGDRNPIVLEIRRCAECHEKLKGTMYAG